MIILLAYQALARYDAIATDVVRERRSLEDAGHEVFVYAEYADAEYRDLVIGEDAVDPLITGGAAVLIYHHGGYWPGGAVLLKKATIPVALKYHNVTPHEFFSSYGDEFRHYAFLGRRQTEEIVASGKIAFFLADSRFNAEELKLYGVPGSNIAVVPPFHRIEDFSKNEPDVHVLEEILDGKINVLLVGRVAPNKGHRHLIQAVRRYVNNYGRDVRASIVGGIDSRLTSYYHELMAFIQYEGLNDIITFRNHVSFCELHSYYLGAHAFLLPSEHEGFCVPILEAQYHSVPVIALDRGAVRETLGEEQLIFPDIDYDVMAAAIHTVAHVQDVRGYLARKGRENYAKYSLPNLSRKFIQVLHEKIG